MSSGAPFLGTGARIRLQGIHWVFAKGSPEKSFGTPWLQVPISYTQSLLLTLKKNWLPGVCITFNFGVTLTKWHSFAKRRFIQFRYSVTLFWVLR